MYLKLFGQPAEIRGMSEQEEERRMYMLLQLVQMFSRGTRLGSRSRTIFWFLGKDVHINLSFRSLTNVASGWLKNVGADTISASSWDRW